MFTDVDAIIAICLEGFFYGKISVCALACILAEKVPLFLSGVGLYSGIFVMYLQCASKNSRMAIIIFYVLCLLYVLSTATFVSDLIAIILEVSYNSICQNIFLFFYRCEGAFQNTIGSYSNRLRARDIYDPDYSKQLL